MKHIAFDLEIVKELPDGQDWEPYRPFGISIISTCTGAWDFHTWPSAHDTTTTYPLELPTDQAIYAANYMLRAVSQGYKIVTLNGLGFDFRVLVEAIPHDKAMQRVITALACSEHHIDIGFAMVCNTGYMCGLQAACGGFGLPGKSDGMSGKLIPTLWKGSRQDQEACLEYCRNDVAMTSLVYQSMLHHGRLLYKTKRGWDKFWIPPSIEHMDVVSAQKWPGEINDPVWPRSKFTDWLGQYL